MLNQQKHSTPRVTISKEEINSLPLASFEGEVNLIIEPNKVVKAFDEITSHEVVGFDTETRPSFHKGQRYDVSLLQLALPEKVFLFRLNHTGITKEMISFLENDEILKAGVGLRDDINALQKLERFNADGFVELSSIAKSKGLQVESVKKLAGLVLGFRISKSAQTSNWEAPSYSEKQISYAATDAWVCLRLYNSLMKQY
ncbi:MAG TPA: 3'-5' exonuclease [Cyclobacteriaceae bacterium]